MIAYLKGSVMGEWRNPVLVVTSSGVGHEVWVEDQVLAQSGQLGSEPIELFVHTQVREDDMSLFGFAHLENKLVFQALLSTSGIGAKTALAILSTLGVSRLIHVAEKRELQALTSIKGIGKKTAERLLVELPDRLAKLPLKANQASSSRSSDEAGMPWAVRDDLHSALSNLGYKPQQIDAGLNALPPEKAHSFDLALKETLRLLSR